MTESVIERLKKFERDHEVYVDAADEKSYWIITAKIPQKGKHAHRMKQYIGATNAKGSVVVIDNPVLSENYYVEQWEGIETFDDFLERGFKRILEDIEEYETGSKKSC
ncbi:MAG TPA: hypothetical protein VMS89_05350 [Methanoregulaceae archaeon]|nr:hypothetical protein [Methanoregulaceae archaeon]